MRVAFGGRSILFTWLTATRFPPRRNCSRNIRRIYRRTSSSRRTTAASEKTTPAFVQAVHPKFIVSSDDHHLTAKQREFGKDRLGDTPLYRTGSCGGDFDCY